MISTPPPFFYRFFGLLVVAVRRTMLALQLCVTAHALLLAQHLRRTRRCRGGARTTSGVVRRTFALGASSFWRTWRPHAHHFSADSLFHGLPMCSVFRSEPKSHKHDKKFVSSLHSLSITSFFSAVCDIKQVDGCCANLVFLVCFYSKLTWRADRPSLSHPIVFCAHFFAGNFRWR